MSRVGHILLFFSLLSVQFSWAQEKNDIIQQRVEFIAEQLESESIDLTNIIEQLNYFFDHPLNLNSATQEDLQSFGILSDVQINDVLLHRKLFGKFISIYELQSLAYWDLATIQLAMPFIRVDDKLDQVHVGLKEAFREGNFEAYFRYQRTLEDKAGYEDVSDSVLQASNSYYHGNADRYYTRLRFSYQSNMSIGVTGEKDPGEEFFRGSQKQGFDFYSAHAFYKGGKYLRSVAIGDYQVQVGQGLNVWTGYAFGKTADASNVKKSANSLRPYTSVDEARFLRGAAVQVGVGDFSLLAFGSYKKVDGNVSIEDSLVQDEAIVESINLGGFHRTNSEIERKHSLGEIVTGANLQYVTRSLQIGVAGVYQGYESPFIKDTVPYNQYDFRGKSTTSLSADYSWVLRNFNFFGEFSMSSHSKGFATLNGVLFSPDSRASMSVLYRHFSKDYTSFYNNAFSEGSRTQNETGLYTGLRLQLAPYLSVNAYVDIFRFPWLKYQVDGPSQGHEILVQPSYKPNKKLEIYARFREQLRQKNSRLSDGSVTPLEDVTQRNYRLNISYQVMEGLQLKSRIEFTTLDRASSGREKGMSFTQDIIIRPKSWPCDIALRYALFDTDSYDTRIYTYENNALYVFSSPSYYYQGSRAYVMVRWSFLRHFDLWARYGISIFSDRTSQGSGSEEIIGNTKTDLTIQLRVKF